MRFPFLACLKGWGNPSILAVEAADLGLPGGLSLGAIYLFIWLGFCFFYVYGCF